jgi:predicted phosphate transport protein (TIGR00153 family)
MATTINFRKLLRKTPFKPILTHMTIARDCASHILPALEAFIAQDTDTLKELKHTINKLEAEADDQLEEVQSNLPKKIYMPVVREDILVLLQIQESIADRSQDIIGLMVELPLKIPTEMEKPLIRLGKHCIGLCGDALGIIESLEELASAGFDGPQIDKIKKQIADVIKAESDADVVEKEVTHILFTRRNEMDAVDVVFLYQIIQWIDHLADCAEKLAIQSRLFLAK